MSSEVLHDTVEIEMQQIVKLQAYGGTESSRRCFVTHVYALFAAQLLLMILFSAVYIFNDGLLTWMFNDGIWPRRAVFAVALVAACFLSQFFCSHGEARLVMSVVSVFVTHDLALFAAADKTGLVQRMPIDFFVVLVALTICSKYWPSIVHNIPHYAMSSLVAFPLLTVLLILLQFEFLQFEVLRFIADILLVLLINFYTSVDVEKHTGEHMYVVAVKLYYNVMFRIAFVMICILVVVSGFAS